MDPFTMTELLLGDMELTPGQLAQLRALNTKYFTELYALDQRGEREEVVPPRERTDAAVPPGRAAVADRAELDALIASDIRDMLTDEQRAVFDRNLPRLHERQIERSPSVEQEPRPTGAPASGSLRSEQATRPPGTGLGGGQSS